MVDAVRPSWLTAASRAPFVDILREEHAADASRSLIGWTSHGLPPLQLEPRAEPGTGEKMSDNLRTAAEPTSA